MNFEILIPEIVANSVSIEHSDKLVQLAEHFYSISKAFKKAITDDEKGRDTLYAFMEHWLASYTKSGKWIDEERV